MCWYGNHQMLTGQEEMASSVAKGGLDSISEKNSSPKVFSSSGTAAQGMSLHPWRYLKDMV